MYSIQYNFIYICHTHIGQEDKEKMADSGLFKRAIYFPWMLFLCFVTEGLTQRQHKHKNTPLSSQLSLPCDSLRLSACHLSLKYTTVICKLHTGMHSSLTHIPKLGPHRHPIPWHPTHTTTTTLPPAAWPRRSIQEIVTMRFTQIWVTPDYYIMSHYSQTAVHWKVKQY